MSWQDGTGMSHFDDVGCVAQKKDGVHWGELTYEGNVVSQTVRSLETEDVLIRSI